MTEHESQELFKFKMGFSRPCVLVHWIGLDARGSHLTA